MTFLSVGRWVLGCMGILLLSIPYSDGCSAYAEDNRLKPAGHETYEYDKDSASAGGGLYSQYMPVEGSGLYNGYMYASLSCNEEEKSKASHAYFDEQNRLLYVLGYSSGILGKSSSYCEENVYQRNDEDHTCRYIYYKSNSMPYKNGFYVAFRYMFEVSDFQFDEEGRLLRCLSYRRNTGSDPNGYSEELFFSRGYEADYEEDQLMAELEYFDYWGTNETGAWTYVIYQYDEQDNCILRVIVTEDEITLYCYEYEETAGQIDQYTYLVTEDWELSCDDGSTYYFQRQWDEPAVRKVAADGTVERELFYGKAMNMGQQHYLMPEDVEDTVEDHMYTVKPGDCLYNIASRFYGQGTYCDLIWLMNREAIGRDKNVLLPGTRLYIPEAGNAQDTKI